MSTLDSISIAIVDCEHKTAPEGDGYALSVGTRAMKDGRLILHACKRVSAETYAEWTRRLRPQEGDLILAREAPVGQVVRVPLEPPVCLGQRTVLIRPDPGRVEPRFLHYWLLGSAAQHAMTSVAAGATVPHLNVADIRALDVSEMPQNRAAQTFSAETLGALDDLIDNNRRRVEVLEDMARAIYREWFVRFRYPGYEAVRLVDSPLGPIPEGWAVSTAGAELTVQGGGTPSKQQAAYWDGGEIRWFTPSDLTKSGWRYAAEPEMRISSEGLARSSARLFPARSVLMTSRATLGVLAIATFEATTNQGFIVIPPDDRWSPGFIYEWLDWHADELASVATGATFKEITKGAFKRVPFVVPAQQVLDAHTRVAEPLEEQIRLLEEQTRSLTSLRDLLLPRLVSGGIDLSRLDFDALVEAAIA